MTGYTRNINNIFYIFITSHLVIWTLVPSLTNHNLPLDTIEALVTSKKLKATIVKQDLIINSLVQKNELVKILGRGKLTVKIDITANAFSSSAKSAIEKAGGIANIIVK